MFEDFAGVWTPVTEARKVQKKPVSVKLAGEPVVLFRDEKGALGALIDRCPHRGVALSLGKVDEKGCLACPFHGWTFDTTGACTRVPLNDVPKEKRARHQAMALPVREIGGLVWLYTGPYAKEEPVAPEALTEPGWHLAVYEDTWNAHWTRAMENMLDFPHVPFVHRRTIGKALSRQMKRDSVAHITVEPTETGATFPVTMDRDQQMIPLEWRKPNAMVLRILDDKRKVRMHVFCIPVDEEHTNMMIVAARNFFPSRLVTWFSGLYNRKIVGEDRAVVESSYPKEVPHPNEEVSVATDGPTLHFRRYYYRELRDSSANLVPAARLARHPDRAKDAPSIQVPKDGAEPRVTSTAA
ncbi:MAG: aromatic ring-hydroxylating dioxygenase subunit alpha [Polyangiaceae bacterium]